MRLRRTCAFLLTGAMLTGMLSGCGGSSEGTTSAGGNGSVALNVTTTFAGEDGNVKNYQNAYKAWEEKTGNTVNDSSAASDETFKSRVLADFQAGSDPDVLFFFNGSDADEFVKAGKVVTLDEIREKYPDYAANMNDELIPASTADGKKYAVPVNGYWEAMFCNTEVLDKAGVAVPGKDYTWDQFIADCQKIKDSGATPIAAALGHIPHYWWEYSIFNNDKIATHTTVPASVEDEGGKAWVTAMNDIKDLYEKGFFPKNTVSATDDETFQLFMDGKAAFLIDGSWKVNGIANSCQSDPDDSSTLDKEKLDKFTVTYVPTKGVDRKTTDLIGGLSMGWYISKKAWDDETKRDTAVDFIKHMTSDETVAQFAQHTASALAKAPEVDKTKFNSLQIKSMEMMSGATSLTAAVQDVFSSDACRESMFQGMPQIVSGKVSAEDAVKKGLEVFNKE